MKRCFIVNRKGFINIYMLLFFIIFAGVVHVYIQRFRTILNLREVTNHATYCEMYIFRYVINKSEDTDENEDQDNELEEIDDEDIPNANENEAVEEHLQYKDCTITLHQEEGVVEATYHMRNDFYQMKIQLDSITKEIVDVAYET